MSGVLIHPGQMGEGRKGGVGVRERSCVRTVMDEGDLCSGKGGWGRQCQCQELSRRKPDPRKGPD